MVKNLHKGPGFIARLLVRYRVVFFCAVVVLAALCALQIPHTNINTDMTKYLPDDYPMRQGLNILEQDIPDMYEQLRTFGSVFADGNQLIPKDLPKALITGFSLACLVLLIMCSSVLEVLLFLVTIGLAVALNMGTNALLPSVSMMTHMLANILQMVLSMDYCIILMNRFRQEKATGLAPVQAMENAVSNASASILSSAFTTIVSLLMLCFMKIKIGADMGTVLAKGVTISLVCNFTVLPCLIVWFDKAIEKTRKKVPKISPAPLARFESRFRIPLAILFVAAFGAFFYLQGKTPTSFSPNWNSEATSLERPDRNDLLLLYSEADSARIPALLDSIKADSMVTTCLSYPSLVQRELTASEMAAFIRDMAGDDMPVNEELIRLVYYACSHPDRNERFRMEELLETVEELRAKGLIDREMDVAGLFMPVIPSVVEESPVDEISPLGPEGLGRDDNPVIPSVVEESPSSVIPSVVEESPSSVIPSVVEESPSSVIPSKVEESPSSVIPSVVEESPATRFTYEQASTPLTAEEMAQVAGIDKNQIARIFRMAGKAGKTMLPLEFVEFVQKHVLGNRLYAAFIPEGAAEQLEAVRKELKLALEKGPEEAVIQDAPSSVIQDAPSSVIPSEAEESPDDEISPLGPEGLGRDDNPADDGPTIIIMPPVPEPTPLDRLADMVLSRHKYSSTRVYRALSRVGIPITPEELDLLYLYRGASTEADPELTMSPGRMLGFVADTLVNDPALLPLIPDSLRTAITSARDSLLSSASILRGKACSAAVVMSDYEVESEASFAYIDKNKSMADAALEGPHYWIGGSEMYKELKEGFPAEVLLLTLLTVISIFLIVAFTFRSVLIPIPLVMTVLTGIYADVWSIGASGQTMYFISYLIVQGILMGATIDYSILFTGYYLRSRRTMSLDESLAAAYDGSIHSILTSGLILTLVPFVMSYTMGDPMICSILKSISAGAATILMLILLVLPGVIAALDRIVVPRKRRTD